MMLASSAWGQGFATEACRWLVAELQNAFLLTEILATIDTRNTGSLRVLERLGFHCVGTEPAEIHGEATTDFRYRLGCGESA
jgi:RimJ/RimL family protein N-acetyltransferase